MGAFPNSHSHILSNIYVSQIATLVWHKAPIRLPVVVGLALRKGRQRDEDDASIDPEEREVFQSIMGMVLEALGKSTA